MEIEQPLLDGSAIAPIATIGEGTIPIPAARRGLAVGRIYFFIMFVGISSLAAYINVYFQGLGITATELGIIGSMTAIVGLIATPLWSAAADARQWHKALLIVATVTSGVVALATLGIAGFWGAMVVSFFVALFRAPVPVMLDTSVISLTRQVGASYPRQRVWGTIGFAAGGIVASWLVVRFGFASVIWLHFLAFAVIATVLTMLLPIERSTGKIDYAQGLRVLLRSRQYRGLVVFMTGQGIFAAISIGFGVLFVLSQGGNPGMVSLMFLLGGICEIIGMLMADFVIRRIGRTGLLLISGFSMSVLIALASQATSPTFFVAMIAAVGIFSGCIWAGATPLAMQDAPLQLRATAVGIVIAAFAGAGFAIGSLVGGYVLDVFGGGAHFLTAALLLLAATVYFYSTTRSQPIQA